MKNIVKYPKLIFVVIFLLTYYITYISGIENGMLRTVFSITLASILSPRKKKVQTQAGEKTIIT